MCGPEWAPTELAAGLDCRIAAAATLLGLSVP
jgi:hypothetical protein